MSETFQITFDCADPAKLSQFWVVALGYKLLDPPQGFASWEDWLRANNVPQEEWNDMAIAIDPQGVKPTLYFQKVPEGKVAKNRLHIDIKITPGPSMPAEERKKLIAPKVQQLEAEGATFGREVAEHGSYWVLMTDPEGNEFCCT